MTLPAFHRYAILPAAGRSVRMGKPKLLLPWKDKTVIQTVLKTWKSSQVQRVFIVVHPDDHELAQLCDQSGAEVVIAKEAPPDMRASLCLGLTALQKQVDLRPQDVVLTSPADIPELSSEVIDLLINEHHPEDAKILVPVHGGRKGHPVLLPSEHALKLFQLPEHQGLNALLTPDRIREIPCTEAGVPADVDTPEDYRRLHPE